MSLVEEIYITARGGAPMNPVSAVEAIAGRGLAGDRYLLRTGYWTSVDECQVTLIEAEALDEIRASTPIHVSNGEHRRNIITRGIELSDLAGKRFSIGGAVLEYDRPRPPCRYIGSITEHGMTKALGKRRGGICARVIETGMITVGDTIQMSEEPAAARFRFWGR
ncbi:MAG: MOSC domain-containing protein [Actinomycetota bacterium]